MYTFKIIEENKENPLESVIEMSGVTTKFTVQQIKDHIVYIEKVIKETKAQLEVHEKQDRMAVDIIPALKDLPQDKMQLVMAYSARQVQRPESLSLLQTSEKTLSDYKERLGQIKEAVGIDGQTNSQIEAKPVEVTV